MRKLLAMLAVLLVAGVAGAADIGTGLSTGGEPGYSVDFTTANAAGTYTLGNSLTSLTYSFTLGANFDGHLYDCNTKTYAAASCDSVAALTADITGTTTTKRRYLLVVITTPGTGTLIVKGSYRLGSGSGGGTSNPLDDMIASEDCDAQSEIDIPQVTGFYRLAFGGTCTANETVVIPNLSSFSASAAIVLNLVNDSSVDLTLDASANTGGITNESTSNVIPAGATVTVYQTAASTVHIVGSGEGTIYFTQPNPPQNSPGIDNLVAVGSINNPDTADMGFGITFGGKEQFNLDESDNLIGLFYNLTGSGGVSGNQYEHSFSDRWEASYRDTATGSHTIVEQNWNLEPPDNSTSVTGQSGGFNAAVQAGDAIAFTGGSTGVVLTWATPVLTFRMNGGGSPPALATITIDGQTATMGANPTYIGSNAGNFFRPYLLYWDVYTNAATMSWRAFPAPASGNDYIPLRIASTGTVGVNWLGSLNSDGFNTASHVDSNAGLVVEFQTNGLDGATTTGGSSFETRLATFKKNLSGTNFTYQTGDGIVIETPVAKGAGSTTTSGNWSDLLIRDQTGVGSRNSNIEIESQSCSGCLGGAGRHGGISFLGTDVLTGAKIVFGGRGDTGDTLHRDQTNNVLRVTDEAIPTAATSGKPLVQGTGLATHGPSLWGISNGSTFDSGDEICTAQNVGMTCQDVVEYSTLAVPTDSSCAATHANAVKLWVMCK